MSIDLRGFRYRMEPARRLADWRLTALMARLGKLQAEIDTARERLVELKEGYQEQGRQLVRWWSAGCDPLQYSRGVQWMAQRRGEIGVAETGLNALDAQRKLLSAECSKQRSRLDAIDADRDECLNDYIRDETARQATQADRDWLARVAAHGSRSMTNGEVDERWGGERVG